MGSYPVSNPVGYGRLRSIDLLKPSFVRTVGCVCVKELSVGWVVSVKAIWLEGSFQAADEYGKPLLLRACSWLYTKFVLRSH